MLETLGYIPTKFQSSLDTMIQVLFEQEPFEKGEKTFILHYRGVDVTLNKKGVRCLLNFLQAKVSGGVYLAVDEYLVATYELYYNRDYHTYTFINHARGYTVFQFMLDRESEYKLMRYLFCVLGETLNLELIRDSLKLELDVVESFLNVKEK